MRRRKTVVGIALFLAANLVSCSDLPTPTAASRTRVPSSPLLDAGVDHAGAIVGHDSCDPATFNAALQDPTACTKNGHTTFQAFIAELSATQTARSWKFSPFNATVHAGENMLTQNVGGETHTFTPVRQYGGGFIQILNDLSGNPVPAPECLDIPALDFVLSGGRSLIPAGALAAVADANGIARVECCLHPWMRTDVRIK